MSVIGQSISFYKQKVDILRPVFETPGSAAATFASGTIIVVAGNLINDGEYVQVNGAGGATADFEFDKNGSLLVGIHIQVSITDLMTATQVRDALLAAIQANASFLSITATANGSAGITLVSTVSGTGSNVPLAEYVANPGFTVSGMTGGTEAIELIRDRILTDYELITSNARCYSEITHSDRVGNAQIGGIEVARMTFFFQKRTDIKINDVLREAATVYNGNETRYWDVVGVLNYSAYDWHIRVDAELKNYHRGQ